MSTGSPYSPPKAIVRDAAAPAKSERRMLRELLRMLDDEAGRVRRLRAVAWTLLAAGAFAVACGVFAIAATDSGMFWTAVLVSMGGFLAGMASFHFVSLRQWPLLRRYLDVDRIRADVERS